MTNLTALDLSYNKRITDTGLAVFADAPLQQLGLRFCWGLSDQGLCSFLARKPLTYLNLRMIGGGRTFTDGIFSTVMDLPLLKLVLDDRLFTNACLDALLQAVPSIQEVVVYVFDDNMDREVRLAKVLRGQAASSP